jgi:hypothetical protein
LRTAAQTSSSSAVGVSSAAMNSERDMAGQPFF